MSIFQAFQQVASLAKAAKSGGAFKGQVISKGSLIRVRFAFRSPAQASAYLASPIVERHNFSPCSPVSWWASRGCVVVGYCNFTGLI